MDADGQVLDYEGVELPNYLGELGCAGASCLGVAAPTLEMRVLGFDRAKSTPPRHHRRTEGSEDVQKFCGRFHTDVGAG